MRVFDVSVCVCLCVCVCVHMCMCVCAFVCCFISFLFVRPFCNTINIFSNLSIHDFIIDFDFKTCSKDHSCEILNKQTGVPLGKPPCRDQ